MYKKITFALFLLWTTTSLWAQIGSAKAKIVLNFREQQSLVVNHSSVDLNLNKGVGYSKGVETGTLKNHLFIQCSTPYELTVRSINAFFQYENTLSALPVSIIQIKPSLTVSTTVDFPLQLKTVDLTINPQLLLQSNNRGNSQQLDVNYAIPIQNMGYTLNQKVGTYQTTILYTLLPH